MSHGAQVEESRKKGVPPPSANRGAARLDGVRIGGAHCRPSPPPAPGSGPAESRDKDRPRALHFCSGPPASPVHGTPASPRTLSASPPPAQLTWERRSHLILQVSAAEFKSRAETPDRVTASLTSQVGGAGDAPAQTARSSARKRASGAARK